MAKLCMCAYSPDICRNFVVPNKRLKVRLCHRVHVKGQGSECRFFVAICHLLSLLFLKINDPIISVGALGRQMSPEHTLRGP